MKHTIIEKAALKAKSEETGIPFSRSAGRLCTGRADVSDRGFAVFPVSVAEKQRCARGGTVPEEKSVDAGFCLCGQIPAR